MMQPKLPQTFRIAANWCGLAGLAYYVILQLVNGAVTQLLRFQLPGGAPAAYSEAVLEFLSMLISLLTLSFTMALLLRRSPLKSRQLRLGPPRVHLGWLFVPGYLVVSQFANLLASYVRQGTGTSITYEVPHGGAALLFSVLTTCIVPAVGEELLFRGAVQGLLRPYSVRAAIVAQALVFALLHREISQCMVAFICALCFGWVAETAGSIRPGMGLHVLNNLISLVEMYLLQYYGETAAARVEAFLLLFCPIWALGALLWARQQGTLKTLRLASDALPPTALFRVPGYVLSVLCLAALCVVRNFFP